MSTDCRATTLEEIEALPKNTLTPADVAPYLGVAQYNINCASKAGTLPWAYQIGTRTIIPKEAFVRYHRYGAAMKNTSQIVPCVERPA